MSCPPITRREFAGHLSSASLATAGLAGLLPRGLMGQTTAVASRVASGRRGVVATVHPLASTAAIDAFHRGGNAIDAAVAASLMLSVTDGHNSGIGGGCLALIRTADGTLHALDGREKAPLAASPEVFFRDGRPAPELSRLGPLAAGVPGLLAALEQMASAHGTLSWNEALQGAADVAEQGFVLSDNYARVLRSAADKLGRFPSSAKILLKDSGMPWTAGETLRQVDLARTLRKVAQNGTEWFYEGEFADRTEQFFKQQGGLLTKDDFSRYNTVRRQVIQTPYRNRLVVGFPPPSSGGIHTAQMLGMLEEYDVEDIFSRSEATGLHLLLEVMKRAMADRAYWLGDADYTNVPRGLLDKDYLIRRASSIDLRRATDVESHGQPPHPNLDLFGQQKHTTHLTTADGEGNVVAITQTVNTSFGCKMIVPGTGVVLNNQMDDFSIAPGVRNAFGLVGSKANVIAPGKRPLSSMSPTIVLAADGEPMLSCGAAGGPKIITAVLQILVRVLDLGQSIDEAIAAPRVHHQWSPDKAICENAIAEPIVDRLIEYGHQVSRIPTAAVAQGVAIQGHELTSAADRRVPSAAMGI